MYIICLCDIKFFKRYNTYIWYNNNFIDMDIKYYYVSDVFNNFIGYLNEGQISSNFTSMYYWNEAERECEMIFNNLIDICVL